MAQFEESEKLKKDLAELRAKVARLKLEKELLTEEMALTQLKRSKATQEADAKFAAQLKELQRAADIAKTQALQAASELKTKQSQWSEKTARRQGNRLPSRAQS